MNKRPAGRRFAITAAWLILATYVAAAASSDAVLYPQPEQVPEWAQQGKYRFARLDGGPIEILKTARSAWGQHVTGTEKEVLGNLYSKYSDHMIDLLGEVGDERQRIAAARVAVSEPQHGCGVQRI